MDHLELYRHELGRTCMCGDITMQILDAQIPVIGTRRSSSSGLDRRHYKHFRKYNMQSLPESILVGTQRRMRDLAGNA
jgi:hypothetical protein